MVQLINYAHRNLREDVDRVHVCLPDEVVGERSDDSTCAENAFGQYATLSFSGFFACNIHLGHDVK
jgi:hypothetical protein